MLPAKEPSRLKSRFIDTLSVDPAVRTGEIDIFEDAHLTDAAAVRADRADAVFITHDDLTRLDVAFVLRTYCVKCTGLRCEYI